MCATAARALYLALALVSGAVSARRSLPPLWLPTTWIVPGSRYRPVLGRLLRAAAGVSFSSVFKGVGIFAGGTYDCAGQSNYTAAVQRNTGRCAVDREHEKLERQSIDDVGNIAHQRIYLFTVPRHNGWTARDGPGLPVYVGTGQFVSAANVK